MRIVSDAINSIRDEFNAHYHGIKSQFSGNSPLVHSLAGFGTAGVVSTVGTIASLVMAGVGLVGAAGAVAGLAGLASLGIVIATFVTAGRAAPTITGAALGGIATPFTLAYKGVKSAVKRDEKVVTPGQVHRIKVKPQKA